MQIEEPQLADRRTRKRVFGAVFLISFGVLMIQIALNRIFSYTVWYHFAYISISLALLGFGASGSLLAAFPSLGVGKVQDRVAAYSVGAGVATVVMLTILGRTQVNPFFIHTSVYEFGKFVAFLAAVTLPFFFAGLAISIALREAGSLVGRLYFWDLIGAGLGCACVVPAIDLFGTPRVVALVAVLFAAAGWIAAEPSSRGLRRASVALAVLFAVISVPLPQALPFPPSQDKDISAWLLSGRSFFSRWGSLFRTDMVGGRGEEAVLGGYGRMGLSPFYNGSTPPYRMIVHDGGAGAIMYLSNHDRDAFRMFEHHILAVPYLFGPTPDVLIVGVGGGADVVNAAIHRARSITGVELDPITVNLITRDFADLTRGFLDRPEVSLHVGEGRHFSRSSDRQFDLLQITGVDTLSALASGAYVLAENYLYTSDAYRDYFSRLGRKGILSICSADLHPGRPRARHAARFASLSYDALTAMGVERPGDNVIIVGTRDEEALFEILTRLTPFTAAEIDTVRSYASANGFETWYVPGEPQASVEPFVTILTGSPSQREAFYDTSDLNLRATTDDEPFFFSYYKWRSLFTARAEIDRGHTLATGQMVLVLLLVASVVFSAVAILLPLLLVQHESGQGRGRTGVLLYFAALGAGFIFLEISFVQRFILFLGYPTYSLTVTLFAFLLAAGLGANLSSRLPAEPTRVLPRLTIALTAVVLLYAASLPRIFNVLLGTPQAVRALVTVALCAPLGGILGMFFPFGIREVSRVDRSFIPWLWAANGCLTVVGSVVCIIVAMTWGFDAVTYVALVIYWIGVAAFLHGAPRLRVSRTAADVAA